MRIPRKGTFRLGWDLALLALLSTTPAIADEVIYAGPDLWQTAGAGSTYTSFSEDPIPAGFFCSGSPPFAGRIELEGLPLVTDPPGFLGSVDTVVRRLDDATFDEQGIARTRLQLLALSLASTEPVEVGCDRPFDVAVSLAGEQPLTEMKILRLNADGGTYMAPLALRVQVAFAPVGGTASEQSRLYRDIRLGPGTNSVWASSDRLGTTAWGTPVRVDTDDDGVADSVLPGSSNFFAGVWPAAGGGLQPIAKSCSGCYQQAQVCHCNPDSTNPNESGVGCSGSHLHCVWVCVFTGCAM